MTEKQEFEPTAERTVADYERYRRVVDEFSPAFREVGIVDQAGYDRAMRDPRTVRLCLGAVELPLLAPVEHVSGYDVERTKRLTGQDNVYVMTTPLSVLAAPETSVLGDQTEFQPDVSAILVETDHAETSDIQEVLPDVLNEIGSYQTGEFLDERIRNPEQRPAMMAMYETRFDAVDETGEFIPARDVSFFEAYDELEAQDHPATEHTKLLHVDELQDNEKLIDELWDLCSDRFDWLGEYHPVSMEDTKAFFVKMVLNDNTHTIVRYDDEGTPRGLGFFMPNLEECTWLKPEFKDTLTETTETAGEEMSYFYGIAAKNAESVAHYGQDIMQMMALITHQRGGSHRLFFESTNMSSRYIPRMVGSYGQGAGLKMAEPISKVAQIDYWYLEPPEAPGNEDVSEPTDVVAV